MNRRDLLKLLALPAVAGATVALGPRVVALRPHEYPLLAHLRLLGRVRPVDSPRVPRTPPIAPVKTYTQIFRTSYHPEQDPLSRARALVRHCQEIELAMLVGRAAEQLVPPAGLTIRTCNGVMGYGVNPLRFWGLGKNEWRTFIDASLAKGSTQKLVLCHSDFPRWLAHIGVNVECSQSPFAPKAPPVLTARPGLFLAPSETHPLNYAFAVDLDDAEYLYLGGNGYSRDTHLIGTDYLNGWFAEYLTECSLFVNDPAKHVVMKIGSAVAFPPSGIREGL